MSQVFDNLFLKNLDLSRYTVGQSPTYHDILKTYQVTMYELNPQRNRPILISGPNHYSDMMKKIVYTDSSIKRPDDRYENKEANQVDNRSKLSVEKSQNCLPTLSGNSNTGYKTDTITSTGLKQQQQSSQLSHYIRPAIQPTIQPAVQSLVKNNSNPPQITYPTMFNREFTISQNHPASISLQGQLHTHDQSVVENKVFSDYKQHQTTSPIYTNGYTLHGDLIDNIPSASQIRSNDKLDKFVSNASLQIQNLYGYDHALDFIPIQNNITDFKLFNKFNREIKLQFFASLDGKFFINDKYMRSDQENLPIACYRRNYNSLLMILVLSDEPVYLEMSGLFYYVENLKISLECTSNFSEFPTDLTFFPTHKAERIDTKVNMDGPELDLGIFKGERYVKMKRFQFKKATPNNGKFIAKDYYYLILKLSVDLKENYGDNNVNNKRKLPFNKVLMKLKSNSISVRGRNPSFYTERNDIGIMRETSNCFKLFSSNKISPF